jgi:hypothetical protein
MNTMRWTFVASLVVALAGCKKEKTGEPAAAVAPAPTEAPAALPAEPPDQILVPEGTPPSDEPEMGGITGEQVGERPAEATPTAEKKDMVAVGSSGKAAVVAMGKKTVADTDSYKVTLAAPDKLATGVKGTATLEIVPKKGWHLNDEFPYKLTVTPPAGAKVAKPEQVKKDTVAFSHQSMKWNIDFEASSGGDKAFAGKVKFAVCTETSCDPKKEELAFNVKVE